MMIIFKTIFSVLIMSLSLQAKTNNEMVAKFLFKNGIVDFEKTTLKSFDKEMNAKILAPTQKDCKECEIVSCVQDEKTQLTANATSVDSLVTSVELHSLVNPPTVSTCEKTKNNLSQFLPLKLGAKLTEVKKLLGDPSKESEDSILWCYSTFRKATSKELSTNYPEGKWISVSSEIQLKMVSGIVNKISLLRTSELTEKGESSEKTFQKTSEDCNFRTY